MDWLKDLVSQKKETPVKRASVTKRTSNEKRFHVSAGGVVLVTPEMLGQRLHYVK